MTSYISGAANFTITGLDISLAELVAAVGYPNAVAADIFKGNDILRGGSQLDQLRGWAGNDQIFGRGGGDQLSGDTGNDLLDGGPGLDILIGQGGADKFRFTSALSAASNVDIIQDFHHVVDKIVLSHSIFPKLPLGALSAAYFHVGSSAHDRNDFIDYDHATGHLSYDRDGTGPLPAIQFATVYVTYPVPATVSAADFLLVA